MSKENAANSNRLAKKKMIRWTLFMEPQVENTHSKGRYIAIDDYTQTYSPVFYSYL